MKLSRSRFIAPALVSVMLSGPAFAAASLPTERPAVSVTAPAAPAKATTPAPAADEAQRYGEREKQAQGLEQFEGGAAIYIGGSALALALLLVILLVLL